MNNSSVQPNSSERPRSSNIPHSDGNGFHLPRPSFQLVQQDIDLGTWLRNQPRKPGIFSYSPPEVTGNDRPTGSPVEPTPESSNRPPSPNVKENVEHNRRKSTSNDSRGVLGPLHTSKVMKPPAKRGWPRAQEPGNIQSSTLENRGQSHHHQPSINSLKTKLLPPPGSSLFVGVCETIYSKAQKAGNPRRTKRMQLSCRQDDRNALVVLAQGP